jgi:hypothetical protein
MHAWPAALLSAVLAAPTVLPAQQPAFPSSRSRAETATALLLNAGVQAELKINPGEGAKLSCRPRDGRAPRRRGP